MNSIATQTCWHGLIQVLIFLQNENGAGTEEKDRCESDDDDEYFDATDTTLSVIPTESQSYLSPSISISTMEGDPPEIEEDKDFNEINDCEGMLLELMEFYQIIENLVTTVCSFICEVYLDEFCWLQIALYSSCPRIVARGCQL